MSSFADYANYYDLLYNDKDYEAEIDYLECLLSKYSNLAVSEILDIGCGTGRHGVLLAQCGYNILGIDRSQEMIALAEQNKNGVKNIEFHVGDATAFKLDKKFAAIISLFHVIDYQTSDEEVMALLVNAANHLEDDGVLIFDFWYGAAVLKCRPEVRIKRAENQDIRLTRIAEPVMCDKGNIVCVDYEMFVENRKTGSVAKIQERHAMRYFFFPELASFLTRAGFVLLKSLAWMTDDQDLSSDRWSGLVIAKKGSL